jgi:hypothetical protein
MARAMLTLKVGVQDTGLAGGHLLRVAGGGRVPGGLDPAMMTDELRAFEAALPMVHRGRPRGGRLAARERPCG